MDAVDVEWITRPLQYGLIEKSVLVQTIATNGQDMKSIPAV